ncbi:MAG: hypothetical protein RLP45_17115, partial [Haliea sp.]
MVAQVRLGPCVQPGSNKFCAKIQAIEIQENKVACCQSDLLFSLSKRPDAGNFDRMTLENNITVIEDLSR